MKPHTSSDRNTRETSLFAVLEDLGYGIIVVNKKGTVASMNPTAQETLQLSASRVVGKPVAALGNALCTVLRQAVDGRAFARNEDVDYQAGDGATKYLSCSVIIVKDGGGESAFALLFRDETSLVEREFAAERNGRLASIGAMTASIAHDIKNPLVALKTFAELFPTKYAEADFRETFTKIVLNEIRRIDDMVSRLLDYAHPKKPVWEEVDLARMISESVALYSLKLAQQKIRLEEALDKDLPRVRGDSGQLRRVFVNLILNAIEAMPDGGTLAVSASRKTENARRSDVSADAVEICIADSGKGIGQREAEKIFEPFFTTKKNGSGLGLTICRKIIEDHLGKIELKSSPRGTSFFITLPTATVDFHRRGVVTSLDDIRKENDRAFLNNGMPWCMAKAVQE